jgi:hypothetical protein
LSEGAYTLRTEWEGNQNEQLAHTYSKAPSNIIHEEGANLEEFTMVFDKKQSKEQAIIKVRFSPKYFEQIIEYEVELNAIPISSINQGKDIIVNWRLFNGFDPKGKFWTDSNSLMMLERNINQREQFRFNITNSTIASNYYPVDSAIAMRDFNGSNLQVTFMNDRAQGGSADLTDKATIEIMQNRRVLADDSLGIEEFLNETGTEGFGLKVNALYYLHIFDHKLGKSR